MEPGAEGGGGAAECQPALAESQKKKRVCQ